MNEPKDSKSSSQPISPLSYRNFQNMASTQQADFIVIEYSKFMTYLRSTDAYETAFVTFFAETLSNKIYTSKDIKMTKRNIILLLNVSLSCSIVYNWYYLMFYLDNSGNRINSYKFSLQALQNKAYTTYNVYIYNLCFIYNNRVLC